jgi:hypothetical protein
MAWTSIPPTSGRPHAEAIPLVIKHGWPGSVAEFAEVIEPPADPACRQSPAQNCQFGVNLIHRPDKLNSARISAGRRAVIKSSPPLAIPDFSQSGRRAGRIFMHPPRLA